MTCRHKATLLISTSCRRTLTKAEPYLNESSETDHGSFAANTESSSSIHNALSSSSTNEPSKLLRSIV